MSEHIALELDLIPAEGRDYMSGESARRDWNRGVEFTVRGSRKDTGEIVDIGLKRMTRNTALEIGVVAVTVRFNAANGFRSYVVFRPPGQDWV